MLLSFQIYLDGRKKVILNPVLDSVKWFWLSHFVFLNIFKVALYVWGVWGVGVCGAWVCALACLFGKGIVCLPLPPFPLKLYSLCSWTRYSYSSGMWYEMNRGDELVRLPSMFMFCRKRQIVSWGDVFQKWQGMLHWPSPTLSCPSSAVTLSGTMIAV